jgi:hypothetical protein
MSESTITVLIAAGILIVLALFVPCMESLARIVRRNAQREDAIAAQPSEASSKRRIA